MVAGNTYSMALGIGEKAAQIISREIVAAEGDGKRTEPPLWTGDDIRARL
jgi:hypothetical protein